MNTFNAGFIDSVVGSSIEMATTKNHDHIAYLRMPRDFDSTLAQIPYFAVSDIGSQAVLLSEDVPEGLRDLWVIHQDLCCKSGGKDCAKLTNEEVNHIRPILMRSEFITFLKMRLVMFQAMIDAIPNSPMKPYWEESFNTLEYVISRL